MRVCDLLKEESVLLHANVAGMADALGILVELQEAGGLITNGTAYYNAVCEREYAGGTTAIGEGIALPHASNAGVTSTGISVLVLNHGLDWGAYDGVPVDLIFMLAVPPQAQSERLQLLARLVNLLSEQGLATALRNAKDASEFLQILAEEETEKFA